jgi:hypothetical protein
MEIECVKTGIDTSQVYIDNVLIGLGEHKDCNALCRELRYNENKAELVKALELASLEDGLL